MADSIVRALLQDSNLKVSVAVLTQTARDGRQRHHLKAASASLFAQGLLGGALMASLQKGETRINLQLECDGPMRGFFVDAAAEGDIRGYVKNPDVDMELSEGVFQWRAALGNSGFISVLRDTGGEYYRSSVELISMRLADDLNHYFKTSDQVATRVALTVQREGKEGLGKVAGVLVQALPDADLEALKRIAGDLESRLHDAVEKTDPLDANALLAALFPGVPSMIETPVRFACTCSHERAMTTLESLGATEVQTIVDTLGSTAVTCQFCGTKHEISLKDLWAILERLGHPQHRN
ncbi:MAG: Hsp33 family molecular chaperone HslO [Archangium sp.]|nr:Hsp33 family molecular chaperone HslO [Archangium sp.]MDP3576107.1 Hsp33 family molecular chaperone HslO [Archangium sp.]